MHQESKDRESKHDPRHDHFCLQDAENAMSEYNLGQYSEDRSDLDTILDNGTLTGASSKYVRQARPSQLTRDNATEPHLLPWQF